MIRVKSASEADRESHCPTKAPSFVAKEMKNWSCRGEFDNE